MATVAVACPAAIVTGLVRDQAQLHTFFERLEDLGLELVSVDHIETPPEAGS